MIKSGTVYPLKALCALALHTQGLTAPVGAEPRPTPDRLYDAVRQLGCIQIDSIQAVQRSQYLTLWSRLGCYDPAQLDRLLYRDAPSPSGKGHLRLFEGWLHAASIVPLAEYRYRLPHMQRLRETPAPMSRKWLAQPESGELLRHVRERIRQEGPLALADFGERGRRGEGWWDWGPVKNALEHLYAWGELMVVARTAGFQRVYDLRERVLPEWVDLAEPARDQMARHVLEHAVRSFGVCGLGQASGYVHEIKPVHARAIVEQLLGEGVLVAIRGRLCDGRLHTLIVHRDNLPRLEQAADDALPAGRTTFLSPFDSLFWPRGRDGQFWAFHSALEAYKPEQKRKWGYFCLAILHKDRLVGRFDPKLDRESGLLRLKALYLEPGQEPAEELVSCVAVAMRDLLRFHGAHGLVVERSEPAAFGKKLLAAI